MMTTGMYIGGTIIFIISLTVVRSQVPSFGGCPIYEPMTGFELERFMGTWFEVERYFTVTELAARCISASYERQSDNLIWVNNSVTNRFTGVKRIIAGKLKMSGKSGEAKYNVQYTTLPINYESSMIVLDTDYDSFAVIWSCNGIGPIGHTESAWVMTRERIPPGTTLQRAYGVLDKYQMSRTFFIKTDQKGCDPEPPAFEAYDPTVPTPSGSQSSPTAAPVKKKNNKKPSTAEKAIDTIKDEPLPVPLIEKLINQSNDNTTDST